MHDNQTSAEIAARAEAAYPYPARYQIKDGRWTPAVGLADTRRAAYIAGEVVATERAASVPEPTETDTVSTTAQLDSLPVGSVIRPITLIPNPVTYVRYGGGWVVTAFNGFAGRIPLPVRVLFNPETSKL